MFWGDLGTVSLTLNHMGTEAFLLTSLSTSDEAKENVLAWCWEIFNTASMWGHLPPFGQR